jgi:hypothetical protein
VKWGDTITFAFFSGSSNQGTISSEFDPSAFFSNYYNQRRQQYIGGLTAAPTSEQRAQVVLSLAYAQTVHDLGCVGLGATVAGGSMAASAPIISKGFSGGGTSGTSVASTLLGGGVSVGQCGSFPMVKPH